MWLLQNELVYFGVNISQLVTSKNPKTIIVHEAGLGGGSPSGGVASNLT